MTKTTILALVDVAVGVLFIALATPIIRRRVKMNQLYGVRFKQSFESDENWYAINEYGGKLLAANGVVMILIGFVGLLVPASDTLTVALALAPLTTIVTCIASYRYARTFTDGD